MIYSIQPQISLLLTSKDKSHVSEKPEKKIYIKYIQMHNKNEAKDTLSHLWMVISVQQPGPLPPVTLLLEKWIWDRAGNKGLKNPVSSALLWYRSYIHQHDNFGLRFI